MEAAKLFNSEQFEKEYHHSGPLGAFCGREGSRILLWAPTAQNVVLNLYRKGHDCPAFDSRSMVRGENGLWQHCSEENLDGLYYDFDVTVDGHTRRTADPYARACGVNGERSMVVDLAATDPEGWENDRAPQQKAEQIIYELHVKDFSWDPKGGFDENDRGRYTAFCRHGTTLNSDGVHPTGLDYLTRLGITHVQLMPVYDFGTVDETRSGEGYNWGYDPVNYNVPEGSYSSDPYDGHVRIKELKEMIASLHRNGLRVIMDVVYNHTYHCDSWLERTVPGYYYRRHSDGRLSNGSGCGNDIATERSMAAKYIIDSVLYWAKEYHMDGFRFDLMGLMDQQLLEAIQNALDDVFGKGEKLIYGEPWRAADTALCRPVVLCDKQSLKTIDGRIGAFCDDTRDAVKGSLMDAGARGFVNGGGAAAWKMHRCLTGWAGPHGHFQTPAQTISYLSCHDDWTLWDKLVYTLDELWRFYESVPHLLRANRLAAAINFCCQGRLFFLSGEEFGRTKGGVKNTYRSESHVNQLDWSLAWRNRGLVDYYRGLIALRMQLSGLQDKSAGANKRVLWCHQAAHDCVAALVDNSGAAKWEQVFLAFNCSHHSAELSPPEGKWQILADGENSFLWENDLTAADKMAVPPFSALILGRL